ncbi:MAG: dimethyl sulfoxide reductase anchor subunit family protein, partial [Lacipirellulaceae bacterium]
LGRPHLAFRAVLGWRHSWLSREAILFGVYALFSGAAALEAARPLLPEVWRSPAAAWLPPSLTALAGALALLSGVAAVFCSAKIYTFTGRVFWRGSRTFAKFFGSTVVLGLATSVVAAEAFNGPARVLAIAFIVVLAGKASYDFAVVRHARRSTTDMALTARLQLGPLRPVLVARLLLAGLAVVAAALVAGGMDALFAIGVLIAALGGELAERWLYFSTAVPLRMPGGAPTR